MKSVEERVPSEKTKTFTTVPSVLDFSLDTRHSEFPLDTRHSVLVFCLAPCYQAVRTAYWVIKGSGVKSVNSCWMAWHTNARSNGSR